ncbi:uncharacterized protein LOC126974933 isoform X2 [Leptidea sinapis]|nr:uncharacterized protein LOC126974933 isoform X2 [Leptidea sinapis]
MTSQRLEEIIAQLLKPIRDYRRSFDTDQSTLLEEYLTEVGLHALDGEQEDISVIPNFAEVALLLEHSATHYSKKVDCLYQQVLNVSENLNNDILDEVDHNDADQAGPSGSGDRGRERRLDRREEFELIHVEESAAATRRDVPGRPPPTLPRLYIELEPRQLTEYDSQLVDYDGEPIGLLTDYHLGWRLQNGLLIEELDDGTRTETDCIDGPIRDDKINVEMPDEHIIDGTIKDEHIIDSTKQDENIIDSTKQDEHNITDSTVLDADTTAGTVQVTDTTDGILQDSESPELSLLLSPRPLSAPLPSPLMGDEFPAPLRFSTPLPPLRKTGRKRKLDMSSIAEGFLTKLLDSPARQLARWREFEVPRAWLERVVSRRCGIVRAERQLQARLRSGVPSEFRGFDGHKEDIGGFHGWSETEALSCLQQRAIEVERVRRVTEHLEHTIEDDGFHDDTSCTDSEPAPALMPAPQAGEVEAGPEGEVAARLEAKVAAEPEDEEAAGLMTWCAGVVSRCQPHELDMRAATADLLARVTTPLVHVDQLLRSQPRAAPARLLLATLCLVNSGELEIVEGAPLSLNSFSVRRPAPDASPAACSSSTHTDRNK